MSCGSPAPSGRRGRTTRSRVTVAAALSLLTSLAFGVSSQAATITDFPLPGGDPNQIARGPDGNMWFSESGPSRIGRITPSGSIADYANGNGITVDSSPAGIVAGPDGNVWMTELRGAIARVRPVRPMATEFSQGLPADSEPNSITAGPDGSLWFTDERTGAAKPIGRITIGGAVTEFALPLADSEPKGIAAGLDGALWFTESTKSLIGRITPAGTITQFGGLTPNSQPEAITLGPDGNLWFLEPNPPARIGRITPAGVATEFPAGASGPRQLNTDAGITAGPDGNLWFSDDDRIGRITPAGVVSEFSSGLHAHALRGIAAGPDGNVWFAESLPPGIGRVSLDPLATTGAATTISETAATLAGMLTPYGSPGSYIFEYGRTTSYGSTTVAKLVNPGVSPLAVSARPGGLSPSSLYHYRLTATNAGGTASGADGTFVTGPAGSGGPGGSDQSDRAGPTMAVLTHTLRLRRGRVTISLKCPLVETLGCHGTLRLETASALASHSTAGKRARLKLGSASFKIAAGKKRVLTVRISRRGLSLVHKTLKVRAVVTGIDSSGNRKTTVKRLTLSR
jgi:streptogramin lyase